MHFVHMHTSYLYETKSRLVSWRFHVSLACTASAVSMVVCRVLDAATPLHDADTTAHMPPRNGSHSPRPTHHSALSMYGASANPLHGPQPQQPQQQLSPLNSDMERQALEHFRASVNNPNFYGGWAGGGHQGYHHARGSRLQQWQQQQGRLEWQGEQGAEQQVLEDGDGEELPCYAMSGHPINGVDDDSCYQEACDPNGHAAAIRSCEGWCAGEGCDADEQGYVLQDEQQNGLECQQYQQEPMAPVTPPQPGVLGSGGVVTDRGLPADPWEMTQGEGLGQCDYEPFAWEIILSGCDPCVRAGHLMFVVCTTKVCKV